MTLNQIEVESIQPLVIDLSDLAETTDVEFGPSSWVQIEQDRIDQFAEVTGDHQWIHVDQDRASESPFGTTIAHGYLTLSLIPKLLSEIMLITSRGSGVNYGMERVRFTAPVPSGSRVRLRGRILDGESRGGGVRFRAELVMEIENSEKPALIGVFVMLALP